MDAEQELPLGTPDPTAVWDVILEFLECAIHLLLYIRNVYPARK